MTATIIQTGNQKLDPKQYSGKDLNLIGEFPINSEFTPVTDTIEYYVYDISNNLISYTPEFGKFTVVRDDPSTGETTTEISLNLEQNLKEKGYTQGTYQTVYNFFRNKLGSSFDSRFFIKEISPSRTEIRLSSNILDNSTLDILVSDFITERNNSEYFEDFLLNFGENNQYVANNLILDDADPNKFTVLIKLYNPLPANLEVNDTCWVCTEVADPKTFLIEFETEEITVDNRLFLQGPNFNIEVKDEISNATNYQTLNDLLDNTELTSSYNQLQNILDQKGISVNIDYGLDTVKFKNFAHFSSTEQRLRNFYYKVGLIENANNNISNIDALTGTPEISSSLADFEKIKTDIIKSFDGFESFMYYNSSSEGTDGTGWPKLNSTPPYILQSTGSNEVDTWYTRMINSASAYDQENSDNLIYTIPEYLRDDPVNAPYELFIEMMGQYFDQLYFYAEDITNKYNADNRLNFGVSKDIVSDVLKSFGIKLYENNFSSDDLYASLLGINASGSLLPPTGSEVILEYVTASNEAIPLNDVNKETYKRIYHNMPYLLKKKGTIEGVRALISLFGIPDTILRISEFGGKDKDNTNDWDYTQNVFNYSAYVSGSYTLDNIISSSWFLGTVGRWGSISSRPQDLTFRFKPKSIPNSNTYEVLTHLQDLFGDEDNHRITLAYTGSGMSSGSYSGSIPSSSNEYAEIALWMNGDKLASSSAPFYDGNWWGVQVERTKNDSPYTFALRVANKIYDGKDGFKIGFTASQETSSTTTTNAWTNADRVYFPTSQSTAVTLGGDDYIGFTGSYQEVRYYKDPIGEAPFHDFVMNPYSIEGENYSSSANDLVFRAPLGSDLNTNTGLLESIHPKVTGSNPTASFNTNNSNYYVGSGIKFNSNTEFIYQDQPAVGIKNRISEKVRFITSDTASGDVLTPYTSIRQYYPQSESYTRDVNYVEVAFSPQNEINDDINSSFGYFNIGEYIGDPRYMTSSATSYRDLDKLRDTYFEKYYKNYNWTDYVRLIKYFDNSLFKMIKDFVPAKSSLSTGVVIKQHLLERNRLRPTQVEYSHQDEYSGSIKSQQSWDYVNEEVIMSSSLIESVEGGTSMGKPVTTQVYEGFVQSTSSFSNGYQTTEDELYNYLSSSYIDSSGIFSLSTEGEVSIDSSVTPDEYPYIPISFQTTFTSLQGNPSDVYVYIISSSHRGEVIRKSANNPFDTAFNNTPKAWQVNFPPVYFTNPDEKFQVYFGLTNQVAPYRHVRPTNPNSSVFTITNNDKQLFEYIISPASYLIMGNRGNYFQETGEIQLSYEDSIFTAGGNVINKITDGRQYYNGEYSGSEFIATDGNLTTQSYEGNSIEFTFTGSRIDPTYFSVLKSMNVDNLLGDDYSSGVFIQSVPGNQFQAYTPATNPNTIAQKTAMGVGAGLTFFAIPGTITLKIPYLGPSSIYGGGTTPPSTTSGSVLSQALAGLTQIFIPVSGSYSIDEGPVESNTSIESLLQSVNYGDIFNLQVQTTFAGSAGKDGALETLVSIPLILANGTIFDNVPAGDVPQFQVPYYGFDVINPIEAFKSLKQFQDIYSSSFYPPIGPFASVMGEVIPGMRIAKDFTFKLIKEKQLTATTNIPNKNSIDIARPNLKLQDADYGSNAVTPNNQGALTANLATRATVPASDYTTTGIYNSRYGGTKVTSPGFNQI